MHATSLVLVAVSIAGVAAGCRTEDQRPVDITPAYCAQLERLRAEVDAQFGLAEVRLPSMEPPAAAPSLPDVIECVESLHLASKAAVMAGQFSRMDNFLGEVRHIAGFESSTLQVIDPAMATYEIPIYTPKAWCVAGEVARVKAHLAEWRARFLAEIDQVAAQCSAGAGAAKAK